MFEKIAIIIVAGTLLYACDSPPPTEYNEPRFKVGEVVKHKVLNQRGIILLVHTNSCGQGECAYKVRFALPSGRDSAFDTRYHIYEFELKSVWRKL